MVNKVTIVREEIKDALVQMMDAKVILDVLKLQLV